MLIFEHYFKKVHVKCASDPPFHISKYAPVLRDIVGPKLLNCTIDVGAQSTLGARHFCPKIMYEN